MGHPLRDQATGGDVGVRRAWADHGVVVLRGVIGEGTVGRLSGFVDELAVSSEGAPIGFHHHEQTDAGPVIARSEHFADEHHGLGSFVRGEAAALVESVVGEPVVLFKEKVNHKHPGGAGFAPHQDARAYRFVDRHISVMVPLDPATEASGCLWFADNPSRGLLRAEDGGRIDECLVGDLSWRSVEVEPGDAVVFDSLAPHRSGTNTSERSRRAMYLTYNPTSEGDFRHAYYADKAAELASSDGTFGGERVRISISDDFLGRPVDSSGRETVAKVATLYDSPAAHSLYDEAVTELQHGLQAATLAEAEGAPEELVVAALLHDVGHLLVGDLAPIDQKLRADAHHEGVGARWLCQWFGPEVTEPVALHVAAKRYLCTVDGDHLACLSASSVRSLEIQGGVMSTREVESFEAHQRHQGAVALRRWDDRAKLADAETPDLAHFANAIERVQRGTPSP